MSSAGASSRLNASQVIGLGIAWAVERLLCIDMVELLPFPAYIHKFPSNGLIPIRVT